jgi:hypothetical protein
MMSKMKTRVEKKDETTRSWVYEEEDLAVLQPIGSSETLTKSDSGLLVLQGLLRRYNSFEREVVKRKM